MDSKLNNDRGVPILYVYLIQAEDLKMILFKVKISPKSNRSFICDFNTTWDFARSITRVSTHEHEHWEHCLCTQSLLKRKFLNYFYAVANWQAR